MLHKSGVRFVSEKATGDFVHCSKCPASVTKIGPLQSKVRQKSDALMIRKVANNEDPK